MTRDQIIDLLSTIVAYDKRTVGESDVAAWGEAARRGEWGLHEALEAVHGYHLEHDDMIKPVHVHRAVRAARRDALDKAAVPSQAPDPGLMRRLEAIADAKSVDRAINAPPRHVLPGKRALPGDRVVADAMRRGEQARRAHAAELDAVTEIDPAATGDAS